MSRRFFVNSSTFVCLGKPLFLLHDWSRTMLEIFLGWQLSSFTILNMASHPALVCSSCWEIWWQPDRGFLSLRLFSPPWLTLEFSLYYKHCRCFNMSGKRSFFVETTRCSISFLYFYVLPPPQFWEVLSIISPSSFWPLLPLFFWFPWPFWRPFEQSQLALVEFPH